MVAEQSHTQYNQTHLAENEEGNTTGGGGGGGQLALWPQLSYTKRTATFA